MIPSLRKSIPTGLARITDIVFPPVCAVCGFGIEDGSPILVCHRCRDAISFDGTSCRKCGAPRPSSAHAADSCPHCRKARLKFEMACSIGPYRDQLREILIRMKHFGQESLAIQMGQLLGECVGRQFGEVKFGRIVPVPANFRRRFARGVNVAELISFGIEQQLACPTRANTLRFNRSTSKQGTLSTSERFSNVRGAIEPARRCRVTDLTILLVDDVMTSGATVSEAARALYMAGAARVVVAVVARGVGVS